jgi:FkbM family methyltransferase
MNNLEKIKQLSRNNKENQSLMQFYKEKLEYKNKVCLFGAGDFFKNTFNTLTEKIGIKVDYICDNDESKWGMSFFGTKCISPEELKNERNNVNVIITSSHFKEIALQLNKLGFSDPIFIPEWRILNTGFLDKKYDFANEITKLFDLLEDSKSQETVKRIIELWNEKEIKSIGMEDLNTEVIYFPEFLKLSSNEHFVDCGAYIGDTVEEFLEKADNFSCINAFELSDVNFQTLENFIKTLDSKTRNKIKISNLGLYKAEGKLPYSSSGLSCSIKRTSSMEGDVKIGYLNSLDNLNLGDNVSFIKMDIEGAELDALHGGEKLIKENKPKLAISLYHKAEHLWEIPFWIKKINPNYKIYIRHHSDIDYDTVCYAI